MINVKNISFKYPGTHNQVFRNFSLNIPSNNIYGLLGKNGTGKSTLLYLISGLLYPQQGNITVDDTPAQARKANVLQDIFVIPEEFDLPNITLDTYVKINRDFYPNFNREILDNCLRDFDLPTSLQLDSLSMGQKKKVYMSIALASGTRYLFMDEPTNGMDIPSKTQFRRAIANNMSEERTIIISTHQVHDVESLLDHIIILDGNRVLCNASTADICDKYVFEYRQPQEMDDTVVYAEPSLQGNAVMAHRTADTQESNLNLELLFNAVATSDIKIYNLTT
jgi:ABC-2 type transport system ATP-binding protein